MATTERKISKPVQERSIRTRGRILRSARHCFSNNGFHGTRIDAISGRAKVNKERIYAYFGSKQKLFGAVLEDAFNDLIVSEKEILELGEEDIPRLAEKLLKHYLEYHASHPHFWRLLLWENLEDGELIDNLRDLCSPPFMHLRKLYEAGQERAVWSKEVSFETFFFMITAISFFCFSNQRTMSQTLGIDLSRKESRDELVQECLLMLNAKCRGVV